MTGRGGSWSLLGRDGRKGKNRTIFYKNDQHWRLGHDAEEGRGSGDREGSVLLADGGRQGREAFLRKDASGAEQ